MRRLMRWAAKLYPRAWRHRYDSEFGALVEDLAPSWRDVADIFGNALVSRGRSIAHGISNALRGHPAFSLTAGLHLLVLSSVVLASHAYFSPLPLDARPIPPSPPTPPPPPTEITDARVFNASDTLYSSIYSSLPPSFSGSFVVQGVGIRFPPLPDMGKTDRRREPVTRVWAGQALEANIIRRVIPKFPEGAAGQPVASVLLEYLIGTDGSVRVLRTLGPAPSVDSARSALEQWQYRPVTFEDRIIQVVSRVEVRFDGEIARTAP